MSKISLKHSGGNVVSLNSPTSAPTSADVAFKLPNADGTSGQAIVTDASGNLSFSNVGKFASYAIICDQKANDVHGGTFTDGADRTRDLNTEISDADSIVSIGSNQFTLQAGSYLIRASAPASKVYRHLIHLYNVTDSSRVQDGTCEYAYPANAYDQCRSFLSARVTISGAKAFEIRHRCQSTVATTGLGIGTENGIGASYNIYTIVEIYKEA